MHIMFNRHGQTIYLHDIIGKGGEGEVYNISTGDSAHHYNSGKYCAKIYRRGKANETKHQKILTMVDAPPEDLVYAEHGVHGYAWPVEAIYSDSGGKNFAGYIMHKASEHNYGKLERFLAHRDRIKRFGGNFTWRYLVHLASNVASTIDSLQKKGHAMGDINGSNILSSANTLVMLIDTDSYQIKQGEAGYFPCPVVTPEYAAPELQRIHVLKYRKNREMTDRFSLAILIFKILMNGYHPYASRGEQVYDLNNPVEFLERGLYPYEKAIKGQLEPPINHWPIQILPPDIRKLFHDCFNDGHSNPQRRPDASQWYKALQKLSQNLNQCSQHKYHVYSNHLKTCPWCKLNQMHDQEYFPTQEQIQQQQLRKAETMRVKHTKKVIQEKAPYKIKKKQLKKKTQKSIRKNPKQIGLHAILTLGAILTGLTLTNIITHPITQLVPYAFILTTPITSKWLGELWLDKLTKLTKALLLIIPTLTIITLTILTNNPLIAWTLGPLHITTAITRRKVKRIKTNLLSQATLKIITLTALALLAGGLWHWL